MLKLAFPLPLPPDIAAVAAEGADKLEPLREKKNI
jgi:hypothetical protein